MSRLKHILVLIFPAFGYAALIIRPSYDELALLYPSIEEFRSPVTGGAKNCLQKGSFCRRIFPAF